MQIKNDAALPPIVALKEWAVTCRALEEGRQIVLARKGGILDAGGVFALEHPAFWLQPTYEHQHLNLVKPEQRDLFGAVEAAKLPGENEEFIALRAWAKVERVWALRPEHREDDRDKLRRVRHIWSEVYYKLRFNYKPEHPLLLVALRVYQVPQPQRIAMRPEFSGCRSWIDLPQAADADGSRPVLSDAAFETEVSALDEIFDGASALSVRALSAVAMG